MDALPDVLLPLFGGVVLAICLLRSHLLTRQEAKLNAVCFLRLLTNRISSESKMGTITNVTIGDDLGRATLYGVGFFCEYVWPTSHAHPLSDSDVNKSLLVPVLEGNISFQEDPNSKL